MEKALCEKAAGHQAIIASLLVHMDFKLVTVIQLCYVFHERFCAFSARFKQWILKSALAECRHSG